MGRDIQGDEVPGKAPKAARRPRLGRDHERGIVNPALNAPSHYSELVFNERLQEIPIRQYIAGATTPIPCIAHIQRQGVFVANLI